jgi:hypothetical protein
MFFRDTEKEKATGNGESTDSSAILLVFAKGFHHALDGP